NQPDETPHGATPFGKRNDTGGQAPCPVAGKHTALRIGRYAWAERIRDFRVGDCTWLPVNAVNSVPPKQVSVRGNIGKGQAPGKGVTALCQWIWGMQEKIC